VSRHAFTLVELLMALAGGLLVCLVAFAALRAAGKTWQRGMRVATENRLLVASVQYALEDLDFWHTYNNLGNYTAGPGRVSPCNVLNWSHAAPFNDLPLPTGWSDLTYRADDPRWWYGGPDYAENVTNNAGGSVSFNFDWRHGKWWLTGNRSDATATSGSAVTFAFSQRQMHMKSLVQRLGYIGLIEYMPANLITGVIGRTSGAATWYSFDKEFYTGGSNQGNAPPSPVLRASDSLNDGSGFSWKFDGTLPDQSGSYHNMMGIVNEASSVAFGGNRMNWRARGVGTAWAAADYNLSVYRLNNDAILYAQLLPRDGPGGSQKPPELPELRTQTRHIFQWERMMNVANIRMLDPDSGEGETLSFPVTGTTLRGARRQRAQLPGAGHVTSLEPGP
jgi:hypothetical protein